MGIVSRSSVNPSWVRRMFSTVSFIMDSVESPRKSILMSPVSSMTCPSYCVASSLCPGSLLSSAVDTGTQSLIASRQMMVPQAWMPVPRTVPSSIFAYFMVFAICGLALASASRSSGTHLMALVRFIFIPSGSLSGIALQRRLDMSSGSFSTRATSLIEFFVAIVP